jgi:tetratricopeptide (TPR) repeat protein
LKTSSGGNNFRKVQLLNKAANILSLRNILLNLSILTLLLFGMKAHAQTNNDSLARARQRVIDSTRTAQKAYYDSVASERKRILDSTRTAQKNYFDSLKVARQHTMDSIKLVREHRADSIAKLRAYKDSKRYKDSVASARQHKLDSVKLVRQDRLDSMKEARQKVIDSTIAVRKAATDSLKAVQKVRTDSLAAIRQYRESKRYKDSVAVVRQLRLDSMKAARQAFNDSVALARKTQNENMAAARKAQFDSISAARKVVLDSLKAARQVRMDSLAKVKAEREKNKKIKEKQKELNMQLALELKIKKKRQAWSNEKMLKKRWSGPRQVIQNTFTRFNYYFNADKKMDEALDNMQRAKREDFDNEIALFPFDPDRDSSMLAPDMDSIIQKASIGIQIHDPRTKWGDDLYLLLGQAYYYKGDYDNASASFKYIISLREQNKKKKANVRPVSKKEAPSIVMEEEKSMLDFLKHQPVHNEALLWLARTYTEQHQEGTAEAVLDLLESDPKLPESLKSRIALEKAYIYLSKNNKKDAVDNLNIVAADKDMPDWIRMRAAFLSGQIQQSLGRYQEAANSFDKVIDLHPKIDMDFYARKNKAYNLMSAGVDQEAAVASLKRVLRDNKYAPYHEQVYFVVGQLSARNNNNEDAEKYLLQSIGSTKSTKKQKALSFASLGNVYYNMHKYVDAKQAYDSASIFGASIQSDTNIVLAGRRRMVLGEVTRPISIIHDQDSLLVLAAMTEKDQREVVRDYIRGLRKKREDSIFRAENAGINTALQNNQTPGNPSKANVNWYFSNPGMMQTGNNEFKRKWGNRPLVDNWRRMAAISGTGATLATNTTNTNTTSSRSAADDAVAVDEDGFPTEQSLLAFIPTTAPRQTGARSQIMRAYVDLGSAYVKSLEDYPQAIATLDTLDKRYPAHTFKDEVLYLRYLIALKQGQLQVAQKYSEQLQREYGNSKWAQQLRPTEDGGGLKMADGAANYYDETYSLLMQRQYGSVLARINNGKQYYNDPRFNKRFRIMEAIAHAGSGSYGKADTMLTDFMAKNPSDTLRTWAEAVLKIVKEKLPPDTSGKGVISANTGKSAANAGTIAQAAPGGGTIPATYSYNSKAEHYVVFRFPKMEQRAQGVKVAIRDFNTFKFSSLIISTEIEMLNPDEGIIVSKPFINAEHAKIYLNSLRSTSQIFREYRSNEYELFIISSENYNKMAADKTATQYLNFYRSNYK